MSDPKERLSALGLTLPDVPAPVANYVPFKIDGTTIYLSGQGPRKADGSYHIGKVGAEFTADDAYEHARITGLGLLAAAERAAEDLARVEVLKVFGMVNGTPDFADHPSVINGCSDVFVEVLGNRGRHARSAIGMGSLPNGMSVEIEAIMRIVD
ncbi:MAG: RidA family protein [Pseudomonadota bacterium]